MSSQVSNVPMHADGPADIQEVVTYCASRLRASLVKISDDTRTQRKWWQTCFIYELVSVLPSVRFTVDSRPVFVKEFTLSYIGMAAAIGQSINIPIVIRGLAMDLHRHVPGSDTLLFDPDFLFSLDTGTDHDDPAKVVKSYHQQWWTARTPPAITDLMNQQNIADFLKHHHRLTESDSPNILPVAPVKPSYGWSRGVNFDSVSPNIQCHQCRLYRAILIGAEDELRDIRHYAHGMEVRSAFRARFAARRAATFYQLYQAANSKADASIQAVQHTPAPAPEQIRVRAQTELVRLSKLPKMKWTPECPLSSKEVLAVLKTNPHVRTIHSGYIEYLPWGLYGASFDAPMSASPHESDWYSDTGKIDDIVNLSPKSHPMHFEFPPLRDLHDEPPQLDESTPAIELPPPPPQPFYVEDPPCFTLTPVILPNAPTRVGQSALDSQPSMNPTSDSISLASREIGPIDAFGHSILPPNATHAHAGSDLLRNVGPAGTFGESCADSDSDSGIEEVTAMEAAAALADSSSELGDGGMVLAALIGGQLGVELVPRRTTALQSDASSDSSPDIGPTDAFGDLIPAVPVTITVDSDSNLGSSHDIGPALAFGELGSAVSLPIVVDSDSNSDMSRDIRPAEAFGHLIPANQATVRAPTAQVFPDSDSDSDAEEVTAVEAAAALARSNSHVRSRPIIPGPFTAEWFAPIAPELLRESSDDESDDA